MNSSRGITTALRREVSGSVVIDTLGGQLNPPVHVGATSVDQVPFSFAHLCEFTVNPPLGTAGDPATDYRCGGARGLVVKQHPADGSFVLLQDFDLQDEHVVPKDARTSDLILKARP